MGDIYQLKQSFLKDSRAILKRLIVIPDSYESNLYISVCND